MKMEQFRIRFPRFETACGFFRVIYKEYALRCAHVRTRKVDVMGISVSSFRSDIYNMLDDVVKTGRPLELNRNGSRLAIVPLAAKRKLDNLVKHSVIVGDPQDLVALDCTRDPFDRIIVANAIVNDAVLITKDTKILENYLKARW